jgi:ATP phosphoribosyltransferase regulatory subunit
VQLVGQGGRYDDLIGTYHPQGKTVPGIGFSLNLETLHQQLLPTGILPQQPAPADWVVIPQGENAYGAALDHAHHLRQQYPHQRVELATEPPREPPRQGLVWVDATGAVTPAVQG